MSLIQDYNSLLRHQRSIPPIPAIRQEKFSIEAHLRSISTILRSKFHITTTKKSARPKPGAHFCLPSDHSGLLCFTFSSFLLSLFISALAFYSSSIQRISSVAALSPRCVYAFTITPMPECSIRY